MFISLAVLCPEAFHCPAHFAANVSEENQMNAITYCQSVKKSTLKFTMRMQKEQRCQPQRCMASQSSDTGIVSWPKEEIDATDKETYNL